MAINMCCEAKDPEKAIMMWRHMIQKVVAPKTQCASILIDGLYDLGRVSKFDVTKAWLKTTKSGVERKNNVKTLCIIIQRFRVSIIIEKATLFNLFI